MAKAVHWGERFAPWRESRPRLSRLTLRVRGLSGPGLSVLHLSDMHLGGRHGSTPPPWLELLDGLRPDIVACTGDYTYSYRSD